MSKIDTFMALFPPVVALLFVCIWALTVIYSAIGH